MKRTTAIVIVLVISSAIFASFVIRPHFDIVTDIAAAIKKGSSSEVAKFFNSTIDLTVPDNEGTYSKTQAELILKDFFTKYPPSSFSINHNGSSNDGSLYAIGTYSTGSDSYRTYFLLKKSGTTYLIQKLEFEVE